MNDLATGTFVCIRVTLTAGLSRVLPLPLVPRRLTVLGPDDGTLVKVLPGHLGTDVAGQSSYATAAAAVMSESSPYVGTHPIYGALHSVSFDSFPMRWLTLASELDCVVCVLCYIGGAVVNPSYIGSDPGIGGVTPGPSLTLP